MSIETVKEIAATFSLSESQLIEQGVKAFLQDQLFLLNAELQTLLVRHGVDSLEDFDHLLAQKPDEESSLLPDFQRADFLVSRTEEISRWIRELNGKL